MKHLLLTILLLLPPSLLQAQQTKQVTQVIDGGHIVLAGNQTIALMGVDAPMFPKEKLDKDGKVKKNDSAAEGWAVKSKAFVEGMILNRDVWLEYDKKQSNAAGETQAYVYFKLDGAKNLGGGGEKIVLTSGTYMINRLLVQYGMANSAGGGYKYHAEFNQLQSEAQQQRLGLWMNNY